MTAGVIYARELFMPLTPAYTGRLPADLSPAPEKNMRKTLVHRIFMHPFRIHLSCRR